MLSHSLPVVLEQKLTKHAYTPTQCDNLYDVIEYTFCAAFHMLLRFFQQLSDRGYEVIVRWFVQAFDVHIIALRHWE